MKKKNALIITSVVLFCLIYLAIMFYLYRDHRTSSGLIIVDQLGGYSCQGNECTYLRIDELNTENKSFKVYQKNQLVDQYNLIYGNRWNFFKNDSYVSLYGDFLAIEDSLQAEILSFSYDEMNYDDRKALLDILETEGITELNSLDSNEVFVLDLDNNGTQDRLGIFTNQTEEAKELKYFSIVYLNLNGKIQTLHANFSSEKYSIPFYDILGVIQLNNEKETRIIMNCGYYDNMGEHTIEMWQLDGKKMKEVA